MNKILRSRSLWLIGLLVAVMVTYSFLINNSNESLESFDSQNTKSNGTRGLVELLEHFGAKVEIAAEPKGSTAIIFVDDLSLQEADQIRSKVRLGTKLVVATSDSHSFPMPIGGERVLRQPRSLVPGCESENVKGIQRIEPSVFARYLVFDAPALTDSCFPANKGAFMVEEKLGAGSIIHLGSGEIFTNGQLDNVDNSILAANLLQPTQGAVVTFVKSKQILGSGDKSWNDLIPSKVWEMFWQLILAGIALAFWRGRRIGKPVTESQLVELPASQLVVAGANLFQNARQTNVAAEVLRADLRNNIAGLIGLSPDSDVQLLAETTSNRTGLNKQLVLRALVDRPVNDQSEFVELARLIEHIYREVSNAR